MPLSLWEVSDRQLSLKLYPFSYTSLSPVPTAGSENFPFATIAIMKINPTSTTLSLILRSLDTFVAPAAQTPEAQAALHVIKLGLLDLLKREGPSIPILLETIKTGEALEHEIKSHLSTESEIGVSAIEGIPEALRTFGVLKGVYDDLTERLNDAAAELSRSKKGDMAVEPLLRRLAEWEGEYTSKILGVTATPFGDDPSLVPSAYEAALKPLTPEFLGKFLSQSRGHPVEVVDFTPVTGGFGKQTFKATLKYILNPNSDNVDSQPDEEFFDLKSIIIRKADPQPIMLHSAFKIEAEYEILRALANTKPIFPSPRVIDLCTSKEIDGPFFTMEFLPGLIPSSFLDNGDKASVVDKNVLLQMAGILARLHAIPLSTFKDIITKSEGPEAMNDNIGQRYRRNVRSWKSYMESSSDDHLPSPFLTWLFHWLEANVPEDDRAPVLTHGDYAVHNVLVHYGNVTGVLDWEGAEFSAPE